MAGAYLGPAFSQTDVEGRLTRVGGRLATLSDDRLLEAAVEALAAGKSAG